MDDVCYLVAHRGSEEPIDRDFLARFGVRATIPGQLDWKACRLRQS
jgi:hypothetical protein